MLLAGFLLSACTLSMEEWLETEEEKGYENVDVVENEYYTFQYKYRPNTRSLTEKILQYVANTENDSVLYFLDSMPSEWMPTVGGCVVANCCPQFPRGLVRRVVSVEQFGGMYKVVTVDAELKDAYEVLEFEMDADILTSKLDENGESENITRAVKTVTRSGNGSEKDNDGTDIEEIDWTMYNLAAKDHKVKNVDGVPTRALSDDYDNTNIGDTESEDIKEETLLYLDNDNVIIRAIKENINKGSQKKWKKNIIDNMELKVSSVTKTHVRKIVSLSQNREYTETKSFSGYKFAGSVGKNIANNKKDKSNPSLNDDLEQFSDFKTVIAEYKSGWRDASKQLSEWGEDLKGFHLNTSFPLLSTPFDVIIDLTGNLEGEINIVLSGDYTVWTAKSITKSDVIDGTEKTKEIITYDKLVEKKSKDTKLKEELKTPSTYEINGSLCGEASVTLSGELFIGVGKAVGKVAAGIGAFTKLSGTAKLQVGVDASSSGSSVFSASDAFTLSADLEVGVKAKFGTWVDLKLASYPFSLANERIGWYPHIKAENNVKIIKGVDDSGKPYTQFTYTYQFDELGIYMSLYKAKLYRPALKLWKNTGMTVNGGELVSPDKDYQSVERKVPYSFTYRSYDAYAEFTACPCLELKSTGGIELFPENRKEITSETEPIIRYITEKQSNGQYQHIYLVKGEAMNPYSDMAAKVDKLDSYNEFQFALPFELYNAPSMSAVWDDFVISYTIVNMGSWKKLVEDTRMPLYSSCKKSGIYVPIIKIAIPKTVKPDKIQVDAELQFRLKKDATYRPLIGSKYSQNTFKTYSYSNDKDAEWLINSLVVSSLGDFTSKYTWMKEGTHVPITDYCK